MFQYINNSYTNKQFFKQTNALKGMKDIKIYKKIVGKNNEKQYNVKNLGQKTKFWIFKYTTFHKRISWLKIKKGIKEVKWNVK